ncbi:MAG: hypothetical protein ACPGXZ_00115 [Saprospiraceae bacterium]
MNNLHFLELGSYAQPEIKESKRHEWVEYGEDNDYFQYLIDRYTNSTTNNAIINSCTRLIYGRGLSATDASRKPNEYAQMMALFPKDCVRHLVSDLKMLGQCAAQIIYTKDRKKIKAVHHIPVQLLRAEKCNEKGKVEAYYFSDNWEEVKKYPPKRIPAYGCSKEAIEIMYIRPYSVGMKYYSYVDYHGALPYAQLEEDISCYLINEVNCGFSGRAVVNFNNGVPSEEQQIMIKNKVLSQLTGTTGEKVIVAFNNNSDSKTTVDSMPVNDAPDLYSTLSEEAMRKIMLGHSVTSPLLFGVANSNGFSSNSEELESSFVLFNNMVIKPCQEILLDAFEEILAFNGVSLNLFFRTLKPLEFTDLENAITDEQVQEETGLELSEDPNKEKSALDKFIEDAGEEPNKDWLLIDEFEVDYDTDDEENELLSNEPKQSLLSKIVNLVSTGTARPNSKSEQDEVIDGIKFITRYVYAGEEKSNSREFCKKMMAAGKIYRKEDILQMNNLPVNKGWGPKGADTYSIWLYKGGGNCYHRWNKQVYASFEGVGIDVNSPLANRIAGRKAEQYGYVIKNPKLVSTRPIDMPNQGFLPKNQ